LIQRKGTHVNVQVQAATLPVILAGNDVLAQAKTGTGKTLGFLIPAIQHLFSSPYPAQGSTSIFIISPTRELAQQISVEAERILQQLGEGRFGVQTVVGGTNIKTDLKNLRERRADILVATPGRVIDLLENSPLGQRLSQLSECKSWATMAWLLTAETLVLDEADRLLDQGFRRELVKIIEALPKPNQVARQTLLFSATIPSEVHTVSLILFDTCTH
jgi:ATP-dependent RNA helicase MSS116